MAAMLSGWLISSSAWAGASRVWSANEWRKADPNWPMINTRIDSPLRGAW
jgi:hypothetical protein